MSLTTQQKAAMQTVWAELLLCEVTVKIRYYDTTQLPLQEGGGGGDKL